MILVTVETSTTELNPVVPIAASNIDITSIDKSSETTNVRKQRNENHKKLL